MIDRVTASEELRRLGDHLYDKSITMGVVCNYAKLAADYYESGKDHLLRKESNDMIRALQKVRDAIDKDVAELIRQLVAIKAEV